LCELEEAMLEWRDKRAIGFGDEDDVLVPAEIGVRRLADIPVAVRIEGEAGRVRQRVVCIEGRKRAGAR